jgi:hypothetical protein
MRRYSCAAILLTGLLCTTYVSSHHSFATHFDFENIVELSGTLSSAEIRSPHSFLGVAVRQDDGATVIWDVEAHSTALLRRAGITTETLVVGDPITVRGPRSRRPEKNLLFGSELFTSDGRAFETLRSIRQPPTYRIADQRRDVAGINRFTGRWLGHYAHASSGRYVTARTGE